MHVSAKKVLFLLRFMWLIISDAETRIAEALFSGQSRNLVSKSTSQPDLGGDSLCTREGRGKREGIGKGGIFVT